MIHIHTRTHTYIRLYFLSHTPTRTHRLLAYCIAVVCPQASEKRAAEREEEAAKLKQEKADADERASAAEVREDFPSLVLCTMFCSPSAQVFSDAHWHGCFFPDTQNGEIARNTNIE